MTFHQLIAQAIGQTGFWPTLLPQVRAAVLGSLDECLLPRKPHAEGNREGKHESGLACSLRHFAAAVSSLD
jgi:hypothetical protein